MVKIPKIIEARRNIGKQAKRKKKIPKMRYEEWKRRVDSGEIGLNDYFPILEESLPKDYTPFVSKSPEYRESVVGEKTSLLSSPENH